MKLNFSTFFRQFFNHLFLLLAIFSLNSFAQEKQKYETTALVNEKNDLGRPRLTLEVKNKEEKTAQPLTSLITSAEKIKQMERKVFDLLNEKRKENGLPTIIWSEDGAKIARLHSENMAKYKFFSHTGLDGKMVNDRADDLGFSRWRAIGENIAYNHGYDNPAEFACQRWMMSQSHRENILNSRWKEGGVGVAITTDGTYYFTQVFVLR